MTMTPREQQPQRKAPASSGKPNEKSQQEEREEREEGLDQTLADSFPASDPPSSIPDPEDEEGAA